MEIRESNALIIKRYCWDFWRIFIHFLKQHKKGWLMLKSNQIKKGKTNIPRYKLSLDSTSHGKKLVFILFLFIENCFYLMIQVLMVIYFHFLYFQVSSNFFHIWMNELRIKHGIKKRKYSDIKTVKFNFRIEVKKVR